MNKLFGILLVASLCSCTSVPNQPQIVNYRINELEYSALIDRNSDGQSEYNGFHNNFEFRGTLLNSAVNEAMVKRQGDYYQWEESKLATEREKATQEMSSATKIHVSFFTPERKNDNLTGLKTIWRVYLDAGGQRYTGVVKKDHRLLAELQVLYPYHTRWTTPYVFEFAVPTTVIEGQNSTLTVTGPLGTRTINFKSL
jgi:hypothetical protein